MLSEPELDSIIGRYVVGLESLANLAKEYHINYSQLREILVKREIHIRTKTEALQKYVKYSICIVCGRVFRMRARWDSSTNHHNQTCGDEKCLFELRSQRSKDKWDDERKKHMSELFTGRDSTGWNIPRAEQKSNWAGGHSSKYYRHIAFEVHLLEKKCSGCGTNEDLAVHHKDKNRNNNTKENLEIFCKKCHTKYHLSQKDNGWSIHNSRFVHRITPEQLKIELEGYKSIRSICRKYHTSDEYINKLMIENKFEIPEKKILITVEQVKQHLAEGKSVRWMNREYGIRSSELISGIIKNNNLDCSKRRYMKKSRLPNITLTSFT